MLGLPRSRLMRPQGQHNPKREALKSFDDLTTRKAKAHVKLQIARRSRGNPYAAPGINPNERLRAGCTFRKPLVPKPVWTRGAVVVDCCSQAVESREGYDVRRFDAAGPNRLQLFQRAGMVLMDRTWLADGQASPCDQTLAALCAVVSLGKPVLGRSQWPLCQPHGPPEGSLVRYDAVVAKGKHNLVLSNSLRQESPMFASILRQCAGVPGSKWHVRENPMEGTIELNSREAVRDFLLRVRRVLQHQRGLLGGKYFHRGG
jgi:hypothetical protein